MSVRVEQMILSDLLPKDGGSSQQELSTNILKIKKPKKSIDPVSKYKVNVNGITIYGVIDYIVPESKQPYWTFYTSDDKLISATGNVIVEGPWTP